MRYLRKWLTEFRSLPEPDYAKYFETMMYNNELSDEIYNMFNSLDSEKACQLLDPVCHQLFNCYKSNVSKLRNFALEFIPSIVWSYMTLLKNMKQQSGGITAFLLGVYNLGSNEISGCCVPSVFQGSIYHEPPFPSTILLTESALRNRNFFTGHSEEIPLKKFDSITSQNRSTILRFAIKVHHSSISLMSFRSRKNLCLLCSRLSKMGFEDNTGVITPATTETSKRFSSIPEDANEKRRCPFEPQLVVELLYGMQFLMSNGLQRNALQAIQDAHFRALYDLHPEIMMVTSALLNLSITWNTTDTNIEYPVLSLTPAHSFKSHPPTSNAITNASFKARKLPDDIDVQDGGRSSHLQETKHLNGDTFENQTTEIEKSPQGKLDKSQQGKTTQKKEKIFKMQKLKENEPNKKHSLGVIHNNEVDGIQLKAVRPSIHDHLNDVAFKSKPSKLPFVGIDQKHSSSFTGPTASSNDADVDSLNENLDAYSPAINLLSQSTFL